MNWRFSAADFDECDRFNAALLSASEMQSVSILHVISLLMWLNSGMAPLQLVPNRDLMGPIMC